MAAAPSIPFPFRTVIDVCTGVGVVVRTFRPSATAVATRAASTSGWSQSCTADWMFDGSVRRSEYPVSPWIWDWKKWPDGRW